MDIKTKYNENKDLIMAIFDSAGSIAEKNFNFNKYFPDITDQKCFDENKTDILCLSGDDVTALRSKYTGDIIVFDRIKNNRYTVYIGSLRPVEKVAELIGKAAFADGYGAQSDFIENMSRLYCCIITNRDYVVTFASENCESLLGIDPNQKSIDEVFGQGISELIEQKKDYLELVDDMSLELDEKIVVISRLSCGYLSFNIYPFTARSISRFDELSNLHYKIEKLKKELTQKDTLINLQKGVIKKLTAQKYNGSLQNNISNKIKQLLYKFDDEYSYNCFISVGLNEDVEDDFSKLSGFELKLDELIEKISGVVDSTHEKIYRISRDSFGVLLRYGCSSESGQAYEKYMDIISGILKDGDLKVKVVKTDTK